MDGPFLLFMYMFCGLCMALAVNLDDHPEEIPFIMTLMAALFWPVIFVSCLFYKVLH